MNRTEHFFHRFDLIGQFLLLLTAGFSGLAVLFSKKEFAILYFMLLFVIGCWQMLSAFIRGVGYGDSIKSTYFFAALSYCLLLTVFLSLIEMLAYRWEFPLALWFIGIVPSIAAIWYFRDCVQERSQNEQNDRIDLVPSTLPTLNLKKPLKKIRKKQVLFRYL